MLSGHQRQDSVKVVFESRPQGKQVKGKRQNQRNCGIYWSHLCFYAKSCGTEIKQRFYYERRARIEYYHPS